MGFGVWELEFEVWGSWRHFSIWWRGFDPTRRPAEMSLNVVDPNLEFECVLSEHGDHILVLNVVCVPNSLDIGVGSGFVFRFRGLQGAIATRFAGTDVGLRIEGFCKATDGLQVNGFVFRV